MSNRRAFKDPASLSLLGGAHAAFWDVFLLKVVDAGLAGCILIVPLVMGGRHAAGELVLVALSAVVASCWVLRQCLRPEAFWRPTLAAVLLLAGMVLLLAQLTPLPRSVLEAIAPRTLEILPLWSPDATAKLGAWNWISLTPADTRAAMVLFVAYGFLFLVTVQRIGRVEDVERLLRWCAASAVIAAAFGLIQSLVGNGKFFWFYEAPFTNTLGPVKGSFTNRNHFAQFLALGIGPLLWWLQNTLRRGQDAESGGSRGRFNPSGASARRGELRAYFLMAAVGLLLFAGLLSLSRAGNIVLFLAATLCGVVCCHAASVRNTFIAALAAAGLLITALLATHGYERVSDRLSDLSSGSLERMDEQEGRRKIWRAAVRAMPDFAILGAGVGSHREVYRMYFDDPSASQEYTHAESGFLQVPLEAGAVGGGLMLAGIGFCAFWCVAGLRRAASARLAVCLGAVAASLAANAVHSTVDFVWYVPGCMAVVAILAGCACRCWQLAVETPGDPRLPRRVSRLWALAIAAGVLVMGAGMVHNCVGPAVAQIHWDGYLVALEAQHAAPDSESEARTDAVTALDAAAVAEEEQRIATLDRVLRWQPDHARAQLALARSHLHLFDLLQVAAANPMSLPNVRDAAIQSQSSFPTREARDAWMQRAFGDHCRHLREALWHAKQALSLCPLQGKGYLYLAELCFLDGATASSKRDYIDQALLVRPFDAYVLYTAANEAWMEGDPARWLDHARQAFHREDAFQKRLIDDLIGHAPAPGIPPMAEFIMKEFEPDIAGTSYLLQTCKKRARPEDLVSLRQRCATAAEAAARDADGNAAAKNWLLARQIHVELRDGARALECARRAYEALPGDYHVRRTLAMSLAAEGQFAEAQDHLRWCLQRRPDDAPLTKCYQQMLAKRLDSEAGVGRK